jgi:hypothetical protein
MTNLDIPCYNKCMVNPLAQIGERRLFKAEDLGASPRRQVTKQTFVMSQIGCAPDGFHERERTEGTES